MYGSASAVYGWGGTDLYKPRARLGVRRVRLRAAARRPGARRGAAEVRPLHGIRVGPPGAVARSSEREVTVRTVSQIVVGPNSWGDPCRTFTDSPPS
ncbi:hypothetical protein GCM10023196_026860 [Actinoallomurus vinaceus]|uniref:Uncharacterized protein n=1 Tax=Actinoallomurus vinaceus TaxID=1080074 RepID=A0ABP8U6M1_9ACTN